MLMHSETYETLQNSLFGGPYTVEYYKLYSRILNKHDSPTLS